ncbi:hypothetical protein ACQ3G6_16645 [Allorhizobium undicola]|uniref:hypothetical protein n=1 Tax=Allorhizobium undicola TaxID=78527 RepID=UPI003D34C927
MTDFSVSSDMPTSPIGANVAERTLRLGAAHDDGQLIGSFFSRPRIEMLEPVAETLPQAMDEEQAASYPPANWLDALAGDAANRGTAEASTVFNPDDNGLYRMFVAEMA